MNKDSCFFMKKACIHDGTVGCKKRPVMDIDLIVALRYRVKLLPASPNKGEVMAKFDDVLMAYVDGTSFDIPCEEGELVCLLLRMRIHQKRIGASKAVLDELSSVISSLKDEIEQVKFWCYKISSTHSILSMVYPSIIMLGLILCIIIIATHALVSS